MKLVTVAEMQALERAADAAGHSFALMMELAGRAAAQAVVGRFGAGPVLVLVGPGNNGGDGLVCARYLHQAGVPVRVYLWKRRTEPEQDYQHHLARLTALGVATAHIDADPALNLLQSWLNETTVVVDALLGTGANRPIMGQLADLMAAVRARQTIDPSLAIVAVDCPSGLNCDTGVVDPHTLLATLTITFAYAKVGHYHFPGVNFCGSLEVTDIGVAPHFADAIKTFVLQEDQMRASLPPRPDNSHKGTYGKLMAVVGCVNYPGAAYLSCASAGRVGAGLVTGAVAQPIWPVVASKLAEPTWLPLPTGEEDEAGVIGEGAAPVLLTALPGYTALLLGCGLGQKPTTQRFVQALLQQHLQLPPTLIDADGLNCLAKIPDWPTLLPVQTVLTPHVAEMARLCQLSPNQVKEQMQDQRWALARQKAIEWQTVLLVKGPYTVIAASDGRLAVLPVATAALATAGTGDVLAGAIAGLLAQGVTPFEAACLGAWLHGAAGKRCRQGIGAAGVLASDLLPQLPRVIRSLACG